MKICYTINQYKFILLLDKTWPPRCKSTYFKRPVRHNACIESEIIPSSKIQNGFYFSTCLQLTNLEAWEHE